MIEDWSKLTKAIVRECLHPTLCLAHPRLDCLNSFGLKGLHRVEEQAVFAIKERFEVKVRIKDLQLSEHGS
jgi:hypothetical protein